MKPMTALCPKSYRAMILYYQRQLMAEIDLSKREVYIHLLRHLDRQLKQAEAQMDLEVHHYSS